MSYRFSPFTLVPVSLALGLQGLLPAEGAVNLEWRPIQQTVEVDGTVDVRLYAVASSALDESVGAVTVILVWDAERLALWGVTDPCDQSPCPPDGYDWLSSGFPDDSLGDDLNRTFGDGNALYSAFAQLDTPPAVATSEGLWVTTFRFQTIQPGEVAIRMEATFGESTRTLVVSGDAPGVDITGTLGPPAEVDIEGCPRPTASSIGCRYVAVTPAPGPDPIALLVIGDIDDPGVSCVFSYVQVDGTLEQTPVFQTPQEWDTVYVGDAQIAASTTYHVQAGCGQGQTVESVSSPVTLETWVWGDVNNDGCAFIDDVTMVLDGSQGNIGEGTLLESLDLGPSRPDRQIDSEDVQAVQYAYIGAVYPYPMPCSGGPDLEDFGEFVQCMAGPGEQVDLGCEPFDADGDLDVDVADFATFQEAFIANPS